MLVFFFTLNKMNYRTYRRSFFFALCANCYCLCVIASFSNIPLDGKTAGMAGAGSTQATIWSCFYNQAALANLNYLQIGVLYQNSYRISQTATKAIALAIPIRKSCLAISHSYYGYSKYHESKTAIAYAMRFGEKLNAAVQLNYHNTFIAENYGNRSRITVEGGLLAKPTNKWRIGFHVFNPNHQKVSNTFDERIPTIMRSALGYYFTNNTFVGIDCLTDIDNKSTFMIGFEQCLREVFFLRAGIATDPSEYAVGVGYHTKNIFFDLAFMTHRQLGLGPNFSLVYLFNKR